MITGLGSQLSVAVGAVKLGVAGHAIVSGPPWPARTGAVWSSTVIVWLTGSEMFPQASVAVQVRVIE